MCHFRASVINGDRQLRFNDGDQVTCIVPGIYEVCWLILQNTYRSKQVIRRLLNMSFPRVH